MLKHSLRAGGLVCTFHLYEYDRNNLYDQGKPGF